MEKLHISSGTSSAPPAAAATPISHHHQQLAQTDQLNVEQYPKNLIEQYLRASSKIKKFERAVFFKRFAPNASEVQADFHRLAYSFEESGIWQYAGMCHIGYAKCESYGGAAQRESEAYLRAARDFLQAQKDEHGLLHLRSGHENGLRQGALHCYHKAAERAADNCVFKAAILRELRQLQGQLESTSSFASPTHQIHDLEISADLSMQREDYRSALQHYDDMVDNIYERRAARLYGELLHRVEIMRLLLLVHLNLPPARQSPAHIKLIEYYFILAQLESQPCWSDSNEPIERPGAFVPEQQQYALAEIVSAWVERQMCDLKQLLMDFANEFSSLGAAERQLLATIYSGLSKIY
ncbi:uncharacterized protein Dwil_GK10302 [Drosophila willistoni]|uniref:Uncharacterized protein n=1 Tax=Drosophila willistoni TaxID=7260 RepID=B4MJ50_DROWI|nr:uncharacterized protein LOC6638024 [Drosophila willistoni]EDW72139.1 uncharacterized protein Dwil_GK10302 [Drosophila willistoni]